MNHGKKRFSALNLEEKGSGQGQRQDHSHYHRVKSLTENGISTGCSRILDKLSIKRRYGPMRIQEIRKIAKQWGIDTTARNKQELILQIQSSEGNDPCFQTRQECENDCLWKEDCLKGRK